MLRPFLDSSAIWSLLPAPKRSHQTFAHSQVEKMFPARSANSIHGFRASPRLARGMIPAGRAVICIVGDSARSVERPRFAGGPVRPSSLTSCASGSRCPREPRDRRDVKSTLVLRSTRYWRESYVLAKSGPRKAGGYPWGNHSPGCGEQPANPAAAQSQSSAGRSHRLAGHRWAGYPGTAIKISLARFQRAGLPCRHEEAGEGAQR